PAVPRARPYARCPLSRAGKEIILDDDTTDVGVDAVLSADVGDAPMRQCQYTARVEAPLRLATRITPPAAAPRHAAAACRSGSNSRKCGSIPLLRSGPRLVLDPPRAILFND